ncbi:hypothetical protein STW0522RAO56_02480 [Raoultella planticola]|nr:hypothetical protein STW0522RAO56_02480 [Raoultella planticola]
MIFVAAGCFCADDVVIVKHCCQSLVDPMPEPVDEPALNGLRLNLRIVSVVMFNFASYLTIGLPLAVGRSAGLCP